MATKQEAAEQAKEFLRQVIKYRFWISISVAALFATIAYLVGSGPIRDNADKERKSIKDAEKEVGLYLSPTIPTKEYMPIVQGKTQVLDQDVNAAWRTLFDRQASLLTWPSTVAMRFQKWGRKWPEKAQPKLVELAIVDYIDAYPAFVSMVYKTCDPFDFETGTGIVSTPGEEELLRPTKFDPEHLPDLGKVWAAQERLWIQRTLLEVVSEVNKNAKSWDEAIIRQIVELEVGNSIAQDQRSLAKNDQLQEAEGIPAPGDPPPDANAGAGGATASALPGGKGGGMMGGGMMGGMGGTGAGASENVFYVKSDSDKFRIMPILMSVLIDQDRVQDFLIELENSPMWIQVKDFELLHPVARVTKPEKGDDAGSGLGMMGGMSMRMMGGMAGMGGMAQQQQQQQLQQQQQMRITNTGMLGMGGGSGGATPEKKGKSTKGMDTKKQREDRAKAAASSKGPSFNDPYFNIVQVRIYGQARFFKPPPDAPEAPPSPGDVAGAAAAGSPAEGASPKEPEKAAPAAASPPATADADSDVKPAPAPDSTPKGEAAAKTGAEPAAKTGAQPADKTGAQPADKTGAEPAAKTGAQPADKTGAQPADKTAAPGAAGEGEPEAEAADTPAPGSGNPDAKTSKDKPAPKTQPEETKPKT